MCERESNMLILCFRKVLKSFKKPIFGCFIALISVLSGCSNEKIAYQPNLLHAASISLDATEPELGALADQALELTSELLGSVDSPTWPSGTDAPFDMEKVRRSAGPVGRDKTKVESGLFRKHCVQCHGLTGDGKGPAAALLAPYPRDFRRGSFKFKSTPIGRKPTHSDIVRTLENGLPGTSMPAFRTLNESKEFSEDVDALAHYVKFLSIRGELERRLIVAFDSGERGSQIAQELLKKIAAEWLAAESYQVKLPNWETLAGEELQASILRGKALFSSELTACVKCHGIDADGKGVSQDFDDWTKDWTVRAGIDPAKKGEWKPMKKYGALKPVVDPSRNLTLGVFRGGSTRNDIYLRLVAGIEGSPMPAVTRKANDNPGLTEENIRDLIQYVLSIAIESPTTEADRATSH